MKHSLIFMPLIATAAFSAEEDQTTTAHDLSMLAHTAMQMPTLGQAVATSHHEALVKKPMARRAKPCGKTPMRSLLSTSAIMASRPASQSSWALYHRQWPA